MLAAPAAAPTITGARLESIAAALPERPVGPWLLSAALLLLIADLIIGLLLRGLLGLLPRGGDSSEPMRATLLAVNNEQLSEIDLADLATAKAAGAIALPGCTGPTGLALASNHGAPDLHLALSACANGVAALVDLSARTLVALVPIGQGPDTAIWQGAQHRFLVPCGRSGTLSIIVLEGRTPRVLPPVTTEVSARTAALDPVSGWLYLPAARFVPGVAGGRPAIVPGSFHLLMLAPAP